MGRKVRTWTNLLRYFCSFAILFTTAFFYFQQNHCRFIAWSSQYHRCKRRSNWIRAVHGGDVRTSRRIPTSSFLLLRHSVTSWLLLCRDSATHPTYPAPLKVSWWLICQDNLLNVLLIYRSDHNQKLEAASTWQNHRQHIDICQWDSRRVDLECDIKNYNNSNEAHAAGGNQRQTAEAVDPSISFRSAIDWMSIRWGKLLKTVFA